jgi:hypothetical protein
MEKLCKTASFFAACPEIARPEWLTGDVQGSDLERGNDVSPWR